MTRQFVIQMDNHPGELAHLARAMSARGIEINHVSCVGTGPLACMFVTTGNTDSTREILHGLGHDYIEGAPVLVDVPEGGGLADVTEKLAAAGVRILGVMPVGRRPGIVEMAFCVDDEVRAREALGQSESAAVGVTD